jgi:hypothetical protein
MKTILFLFALVLLIIAAPVVHAQKPAQELPELQEWYSWSGATGAHISYLPGFSANGGMNAVTQKRAGDPTWFNRFAYDTTNQFSWGSSWIVMPVDFNGDGLTDYIDYDGNVYQGVKKNSPPMKIEGVQYQGFRGGEFVGDFNHDGYEDIIVPTTEGATFTVLLGGQDLKKLRRKTIDYPFLPSLSKGISVYLNENNEPRLLIYNSNTYREGFYLYSISFSGSPSDSIIVSLKELDRIIELKQNKTDHFIDEGVASFYENKKTKEYTLLVSYDTPNVRTMPFAIINDKFIATKVMKISTARKYCLSGSIDGDDEPDWINVSLPDIVYSGNPAKDGTPRLKFPTNNKCYLDGYYSYIGDVTGDGIGDIALGKLYCFSIFKGIDWHKLSVTNEIEKIDFTLHQSEPNPISSDGKAIVPITLARGGNYTLEVYTLTGKRLGELFSGELPSGEVRLPLDVKQLNIASGMYELRLSDGKHTRGRAFVVQR